MTPRFRTIYKEQVIPNLGQKLNYKNSHQLPKLEKIQVNRGLGLSAQNSNILKKSIQEFRVITGQKPIITKSKKSNAGFKIREEMDLGLTVTLRGEKMYTFLDKLINLTLPQVRDFKGLSSKSFDRDGNYTFAIKEQLIFPEINYEDVDQIRGFDITIVTTGKNKDESKALLAEFGFPFND
ncbi:50S ribosomal protein L5 [Gloeomargaritaceae cyanobacterium AH-226-B11]|jgi:large subunit ribosomal protein L5|nr:50S ribosomal protein L5 [Gloeomargaritaceae cyanobacterium AH-226-B11]